MSLCRGLESFLFCVCLPKVILMRKEGEMEKEKGSWVWYSRFLTAFIALLLPRQININFPMILLLPCFPRLEIVREQRESEFQDGGMSWLEEPSGSSPTIPTLALLLFFKSRLKSCCIDLETNNSLCISWMKSVCSNTFVPSWLRDCSYHHFPDKTYTSEKEDDSVKTSLSLSLHWWWWYRFPPLLRGVCWGYIWICR